MLYIGTKGEQLLRSFKKKLLRCLNVNVQIKTRIATTKLNLFIELATLLKTLTRFESLFGGIVSGIN